MIFVELDSFVEKVPPEWSARAASLSKQLREVPDAEDRRRIIADNADMWRELKTLISSISSNKCWYCESRDMRSDNAVDHFRPKGRVAHETHGGYWWLAFDPHNYRFSCTYCNSRRVDEAGGTSGGKQDAFPLADGSHRAITPDDSLEDEVPVLLDPCCIPDTDLLWFDETGQVVPNPSTATDSWQELRVRTSVRLYHLDHVKLVESRRRVYLQVYRLIRAADRTYRRWRSGDEGAKDVYQDLLVQLRSQAVREAEHSATARCALLGYRVSSGAADAVLRFL